MHCEVCIKGTSTVGHLDCYIVDEVGTSARSFSLMY
jgi:hypothetical protein